MSSLTKTNTFQKYEQLYKELKILISETKKRLFLEEPDKLFEENVNFFNKSFMVVTCTYLESYLKEVCLFCINSVNQKLSQYPLPYNLIHWSVLKGKEKELHFKDFLIEIDSDAIDDEISGNVGKTIAVFAKIGINLLQAPEFRNHKDTIAGIVTKRNNIIHHNDDASDVSFDDILGYIDSLLAYMECIDTEVVTFSN
jgi:hypothetical protein